jgi:hypothetical protein
MTHALFSLSLRSKRDAIIARQRTRQLAGLLGYDAQEQVRIAAAVFAAAWRIRSLRCPVELYFQVDNDVLRVTAQSRRQLRGEPGSESSCSEVCLERRLPARSKLCPEDLAWAINKLDQITPAQLYEEVYVLNQELLSTMQALDACQTHLSRLKKGDKPSAA